MAIVVLTLLLCGPPAQQDSASASDLAAFKAELSEIQAKARFDGDLVASNRDTVRKLIALEAAYRDRDVPRDRLAFVLYDAGRRLELRLGSAAEASNAYREAFVRYPNTPFGAEAKRSYTRLNLEVGRPFPEVTGKGLDGSRTFTLQEELGEWTLVHFFTPAESVCREEIARLQSLEEELRSQGLRVFAIALTREPKRLASYLGEKGIDWIVISDGEGFESPWASTFSLEFVPQSYLLDAKGAIVGIGLHGEEGVRAVRRLVRRH